MKRIAVFASGEGSNFEAIAAACERGAIAAEVALVVCDRPGARVTERAAARGIACFAFAPKEYASKADYEREIVARLDAARVDLVCLAGYMRILSEVLLGAYGGRIVNIHPSLLPAFKGAHAIEEAVAYGVKVYGVTIHWVDAATALDAEVRVYSELFSDPAPDGADKDFLACMNPDSLEVLTGCKVEPRMRDIAAAYDKTEKKGKTAPSFQFMRLGYFCLDNKDCSEEHLVFNRSVTLKDSFRK